MKSNKETLFQHNLWPSERRLRLVRPWLSRQIWFHWPDLALFAVWVGTMIALPVAKHLWGEAAVTWGVVLTVTLQASLVVLILYRAWGLLYTARVTVSVILLAWAVEAVGSATGLPFGAYHYTARLQPQVGHVPLLIPLAWLMMLPPAWAVAYRGAGFRYGPLFVGLAALAFAAWDLFLDPQMVGWGLWVWDEPGGYFGIPWLNYAGWALAAALITVVVRPRNIPVPPLLLIYIITWLLETVGLLVFWGLPGPALVGFVGMGGLVWLAWMAK